MSACQQYSKNFADICDRLGIKSALYTVYQVECALTHPTTNSSGVFLTRQTSNTYKPTLQPVGILGWSP